MAPRIATYRPFILFILKSALARGKVESTSDDFFIFLFFNSDLHKSTENNAPGVPIAQLQSWSTRGQTILSLPPPTPHTEIILEQILDIISDAIFVAK